MYNELSSKMIGNLSFSFYKIYMQTMLFFRGSFSFSPWPWGCSGHSVKNPKPQKNSWIGEARAVHVMLILAQMRVKKWVV
jgi:hypothetical protein